MPDAAAHSCTYPPHGDLLDRPDDRCVTCGQQRPASRTVAVDEAFLRQALRDALCFAEYHATAGDPDSPQYIREYETALLELADAPEATPAAEVARLRSGGETLGRIVVRMSRSMQAARIDMLQNGPKAGMQWILNSLPDVDDDDPADQWDGKETAAEWLDRTDERKAATHV